MVPQNPPDELLTRRLAREVEVERERRSDADFHRFIAACHAYRSAARTFQAEHRRALRAGVLGPVRADREVSDYEFYAREWTPSYPGETGAS